MKNTTSYCRYFALGLAVLAATSCGRNSENEVGEFKNDFIGNEIKVQALSDPKVEGVTCHLTHFDRGFWDRVSKGNWFEDPSNASIACRQTGPISIGEIDYDKDGEEVFSQRMSLVFKSIAVRRIFDPENKTLIYVVYSRRPVEGSAKMGISTIALYGQDISFPLDQFTTE
ncbi:CreA family protein [Hyphococcus lacteus]|uniref:CreA family protein n=1 Tax=Hyphococcus lacteus TaxID=3143536 RepID=A0ABV3Z5B6_9PROT